MRMLVAALLGAACLAALFGVTTSAQVVEPTPCEQRCEDQNTLCLASCGASNDPIECEARCEDQHGNCLLRCS